MAAALLQNPGSQMSRERSSLTRAPKAVAGNGIPGSKVNEEARLVERKGCFISILEAGNGVGEGGGWCRLLSKGGPLGLTTRRKDLL